MNSGTPAPDLRDGPEPDTVEAEAIERILTHVGKRIVVGLPLGLGKPVRLVNALYHRVAADPSLTLEVVTALSLDLPEARGELERRFLEPFLVRHFGEDLPRLAYVGDVAAGTVPENIRVTEFYLRSGAALGNPLAQRHYISTNYTHVARDLVDRGVNLVLQQVAAEPDGDRLSLSCNPDVTLELATRLEATPVHRCHKVARIHPELPFLHGDAIVPVDFFDEVLPSAEHPGRLFALPRQPVSPQDYGVGLHAATLIEDGGTLQIGIGALSDALVHALLLRHRTPARFRETLSRLPGAADPGGTDGAGRERAPSRSPWPARIPRHHGPFERGLYGASEMFMDGFMHLYHAGILRREVFDDEALQRKANDGPPEALGEHRGRGAVMDAAFFLGSRPFYEFLAGLEEEERPRFRMTSVERINQLYGGSENLEILQRRGARFFNTCMMVTATGTAVSDGLEDYQMVSGVGGQYNFVAMAHAMRDGRSVLMLRSTRGRGRSLSSNLVWEHPHGTIPRHLRDLVVTEYGVAELRGRTDEECIQAIVQVMDARFQPSLVGKAKDAGKLDPGWEIPEAARTNTPERLRDALGGFRPDGGVDPFPSFPFGSDFTPVEVRLVRALRRLEAISSNPLRLAAAWGRGRPARHAEPLARMALAEPSGWKERAYARLLAFALEGGP